MTAIPAAGREAGFHVFLHRTAVHLRSAREVEKVLRHVVRAAVAFFEAEAGAVAVLDPGAERTRIRFSHRAGQPASGADPGAAWDEGFFAALLRGERPAFPRGLICAAIERRGRPWGVVALRRSAGRFERWQERALGPLADETAALIAAIDRERLAEVRARIDGKIMRELAPKDLYYQILDGLHQLTRYDHSAALYIFDPAAGTLQLVAEQVAWRKMKSERIGQVVAATGAIASLLGGSMVYGFDRRDRGWNEWTGIGAAELAEAVDGPGAALPAEAPEIRALLAAPLGTPGGVVGLLRLAALRAGAFGAWEREVVARFAPVVSLVLQRSRTLESLQTRMLDVERRNTLALLARGVAHDINNALGAVAPLLQQMQVELERGTFDPADFRRDLAQIESSVEVCRRIFSGMLRVARGSARHDGTCDLRRAVDTARDVLRESLVRQGVRFEVELPDALPPVLGGQEDVERVLLNLATNAREAMPRGGLLALRVEPDGDALLVRIEDDGPGIPPELIRRIDTPFFSTKPEGWGLGIPTCRSIVAEIGGELRIESEPGRGTRVTVRLRPAVVAEPAL